MEQVFLEKLINAQVVRKLPAYVEPEVWLSCPQEPAIAPYREPVESSLHSTSHFFKMCLFTCILPAFSSFRVCSVIVFVGVASGRKEKLNFHIVLS
jgi:hypothetical protein